MSTLSLRGLVSTAWLAQRLSARTPGLHVIDATYHLPALQRNAQEEYAKKHLPGATYFDVDGVKDTTTDLPHMLPSSAVFSKAMQSLGVNNGEHVVVYDCSDCGLFSAARLWWMLRVFGHESVSVLDGGLVRWVMEERPVESGVVQPKAGNFVATSINKDLVRLKTDMVANLVTKKEQVVDARGEGRWLGTAPEPRPGLRSGHIPGSRNIPYTTLLDSAAKTFLPADQLRKIFTQHGVDPHSPLVASCGSGVTACVLALAAHVAFPHARPVPVYDGSWAEWGSDEALPVEKGGK